MFYANSIRCFLSSREGLVSILRPASIRQKYWKQKIFCQVSVYTKANDGKKEIGSTYSFIVVCCQYWLSHVRPDGSSHSLHIPASPLFSLTEAVYWASVTGDIDIAIIVIQLCQQVHSQHHNIIHIIIFALVLRCEMHQLSKHVTLSKFKIEFVSLACCSTSRCTFSWRNVY